MLHPNPPEGCHAPACTRHPTPDTVCLLNSIKLFNISSARFHGGVEPQLLDLFLDPWEDLEDGAPVYGTRCPMLLLQVSREAGLYGFRRPPGAVCAQFDYENHSCLNYATQFNQHKLATLRQMARAVKWGCCQVRFSLGLRLSACFHCRRRLNESQCQKFCMSSPCVGWLKGFQVVGAQAVLELVTALGSLRDSPKMSYVILKLYLRVYHI